MTALEPLPTQLALDGIDYDEHGLTGHVDPALIPAALHHLVRFRDAWQWVAGDLAVALQDQLGEADGNVAMAGLDIGPAQLARCIVVARTFPRPRRRPLSWTHHERLLGLDADEADRLLDRCVAEKLTLDDLAELLNLERERRAPRLPGMVHVPKPPKAIASILERDPEAWVLWQPATGTVKEAEAAS